MREADKTKKQLIDKLATFRGRTTNPEKSETELEQAKEVAP